MSDTTLVERNQMGPSKHTQPRAQKAYARFLKRAKAFLNLDWSMIENMADLQIYIQDVIDGDYADKRMLYRAKMLWADIQIARTEEAQRA